MTYLNSKQIEKLARKCAGSYDERILLGIVFFDGSKLATFYPEKIALLCFFWEV